MNIKYFLTVFTSIIETACLAAVEFGWRSLDFIFTHKQYFKNACETLNKKHQTKHKVSNIVNNIILNLYIH